MKKVLWNILALLVGFVVFCAATYLLSAIFGLFITFLNAIPWLGRYLVSFFYWPSDSLMVGTVLVNGGASILAIKSAAFICEKGQCPHYAVRILCVLLIAGSVALVISSFFTGFSFSLLLPNLTPASVAVMLWNEQKKPDAV